MPNDARRLVHRVTIGAAVAFIDMCAVRTQCPVMPEGEFLTIPRLHGHPGRMFVLAALLACLSAGVIQHEATPTGSAIIAPASNHPVTPADRRGPFALILVIDAARYDEINLAQMPNLARMAAMGTWYDQAWVGQLPTITETSHATIGTGVFPSRHLVLGETWRIPGTSTMAPDLLNSQLTRTGYLGNFIRSKGVPTIAGMVHRQYPGSVVVALSGHKIYAADALGAGAADYIAFGTKDARGHYVPSGIPGHVPGQSILTSSQLDLPAYPRTPGEEDSWTATLAEKFLFKYHPRLMMINLPEVDVYGHIAGTDGSVMQPLMANVDKQIGRLLAAYGRAGMLAQTNFVVTSDHAMVPALHAVTADTLNSVIKRAGGISLYVGHGDYSPIWLKNVAQTPRVAAALAATNIPDVSAVYARQPTGQYLLQSPVRVADGQMPDSYSRLLSTFASAEAPDIVVFYDENTITMTPSFLKINRKGDHGGATWGSQHIPLILMGPNIKQAYRSTYPARLVDIAPTVESLLGVKPVGQDGLILADAMVKPPAGAIEAQTNGSLPLLNDVAAMEREAADRPNNRR